MSQEQKSKQTQQTEQSEGTSQDTKESQVSKNKLANDVDEMLEEIDSVLEENAEEWVRGFVQKGGEASRLSKKVSRILTSWTLITEHALNVVKKFLSECGEDLIFQLAAVD